MSKYKSGNKYRQKWSSFSIVGVTLMINTLITTNITTIASMSLHSQEILSNQITKNNYINNGYPPASTNTNTQTTSNTSAIVTTSLITGNHQPTMTLPNLANNIYNNSSTGNTSLNNSSSNNNQSHNANSQELTTDNNNMGTTTNNNLINSGMIPIVPTSAPMSNSMSGNSSSSLLNVFSSLTRNTGPTSNSTNTSGATIPISVPTPTPTPAPAPPAQSLAILSITAPGGSGIESDPYIFDGSNINLNTLTLTYKNLSSDTITITGISQTNSPVAWSLANTSTCSNTLLSPNATCTIIFENMLAINSLAISGGIGAVFTTNLTVPTLIFNNKSKNESPSTIQPTLPAPLSGTTVFVTNHQATVANNAIESDGMMVVTNTMSNASGYNAIIVTSKFENYFTGIPTTSGCSYFLENDIVTQNCILTPSSNVGSVSYTIESAFLGKSLNILYSISHGNQTISMTPIAQQIPLQ